jgi:hypothetical protein
VSVRVTRRSARRISKKQRDGRGIAAVGVVDQVEVLADHPARLARERHVVALRDRERAQAAAADRGAAGARAGSRAGRPVTRRPVLDVARRGRRRGFATRARHCSITSDEELQDVARVR